MGLLRIQELMCTLTRHEIVKKEAGLVFKPTVQYGGKKLDSQCGTFAYPDPPKCMAFFVPQHLFLEVWMFEAPPC